MSAYYVTEQAPPKLRLWAALVFYNRENVSGQAGLKSDHAASSRFAFICSFASIFKF